MKVYQAINAVQSELASIGISKDRKNAQQGYAFRGIDDVYLAIAPLLAKHKLCIIPRYMARTCAEHASKSGGTLFYVTVEGEFDFVAEDGSKHTARMFGEAMDSGDKATNKAQSAAYKYLCLQTFCIPTEGDNDADGQTHEVTPRPAPPKPPTTKDDAMLRIELAKLLQPIADDANKYFQLFKDKNGKELSWLMPNETTADLNMDKVKLILANQEAFMKAIQKAMDNVTM